MRTLFYSTESQESKSEVLSTVVRFDLCCRACHRRSSSWFSVVEADICLLNVLAGGCGGGGGGGGGDWSVC